MYTKCLLLAATPLIAVATVFAAPEQARAQYYSSPWYTYYGTYPGYYYNYGRPNYWGGYYSPYWYGPRYDTVNTAPQTYSSNYAEPQDARTASITVQVPADAEVWFGNVLTRQQGNERQFVSPPLQSGPYVYDIRARWTDNGQVVDRTKQAKVRAGERTRVNFMEERVPLPPEPAGQAKPAPQPAAEKQ